MAKLKLTDFKGQNRKVARVNLNPNQFYLARDVRVDKEIGKIMIRPGLDAKYTSGTPTIDGIIHKIINWIEADGDERVLLIQAATTGWRIQEGTDTALITAMLADTGLTRGTHQPNVIIHNDIVRVYLGNIGGAVPLLTTLWYGYIDKTFFRDIHSVSDFAKYYLASTHLFDDPYMTDASAWDTSPEWGNNGMLRLDKFNDTGESDIVSPVYRITYIYDGYQESTFVRNDAGDYIEACSTFSVSGDYTTMRLYILGSDYSNALRVHSARAGFNKRITGINVYRTKDTVTYAEGGWGNRSYPKAISDGEAIDASWYLVKSINIDLNTGIDGADWAWDSGNSWYHLQFYDRITDTLLTDKQSYATRTGHESTCDFADMSYVAYHKQRIWAVKVFDRTGSGITGDDSNNKLYFSSAQVVSTGTNYALDSIANLNFIFIGQDDGAIPTGIVEWGDRLLIFKEDYRYKFFAAATVANSFVEETINKGCYAPRTLKKTSFGIFFLARDTVYLFDGVRDIEIGTAIERQLQADYTAAQLKAAFAVYDNEQQQYLLFISDGSDYTCFVLSMRMNPPEWTEYRFYKGVSSVTLTDAHYLPDNKVYIAVNTNSVYSVDQLNEDNVNDNGTAIIPIIQSKIFTGSGQDKNLLFTKVGIRHKGREFTLQLYKEGGASLGTITFSNNTNLSSVLKNIAETFQANEVYFTITKSTDADSVTNFEIDDIEFDVDEPDRMLE